jgi:hypothetical protein
VFQIANSGAGLYGERLAVALGFVTLAFALATFASCRSCLSLLGRLHVKNPMETRPYRTFYKYHGYYWSIFLLTLILHLISAVMHTAIPTADDPDAQIHWVILGFAFGSLVSTGVVLSSCRSLVNLLNLFAEKGPLSNLRYQLFYQYHSYYWVLLILAIAGHVASAYLHTGIWPG